MLAKLTAKNQVTLPKAAVSAVDSSTHFEVTVEDGRIVLTPVRFQKTAAIRDKLQRLGITQEDIAEAVTWARQ